MQTFLASFGTMSFLLSFWIITAGGRTHVGWQLRDWPGSKLETRRRAEHVLCAAKLRLDELFLRIQEQMRMDCLAQGQKSHVLHGVQETSPA